MVHNIKLKKRIWSLLLCLCMVLSCLPVSVFAESGTTTVDEAKWGTDQDNLTGSGTLQEAVAAAKNDSTIKYIQLNKSWTATGTSETKYYIEGEGITFDLNGKTVSGPLLLRVNSGSVTFTDSVGGGEWENTKSGSEAVNVNSGASATFTGGSYKGSNAVYLPNSSGVAVIKGGTFAGIGRYVISSSGTLTVNGGVFIGQYGVYSGSSSQSTIITGGDFSQCTVGAIIYYGGTLDLSSYPTTATAGTTPLTDLTLMNVEASTAVGTAIKLPADYGFYKVEDTTQAIVTELEADTKYAIKSTVIPEAKWGTSKDNLTGSGTLAEAIAAAVATGSTVKYIRLQKDVTASETYTISGGEFVLDLNGCSVTVGPSAFKITDGKVTFQDSSTAANGKVECTDDSTIVFSVVGGEVTFTGGQYKGPMALFASKISDTNTPIVTIKSGSFTGTTGTAVAQTNSTLTIEGGSFTAGGSNYFVIQSEGGSATIKGGSFTNINNDHIYYSKNTDGSGTLDLSGYPTEPTTGTTAITALRVGTSHGNSINVGTDIKLPGICSFYCVTDTEQTTVTTLVGGNTYAIKMGIPEAKWGTSKDNLTGSGTLAEAVAAAKNDSTIKYIQLNKSWTATGTSVTDYYIRGEGITFDLNGQKVSGPLALRAYQCSVTFTDSVGGGEWENTVSGYPAVNVDSATATFTGGSFKAKSSAVYTCNASAIVVINGGTFTIPKGYPIFNSEGTMTVNGGVFIGEYGVSSGSSSKSTIITGGDFSQCTKDAIIYYGGTLDLSGYPTATTTGTTALTDLTLMNLKASTAVGTDIKLPEGYGFYKVGDTAQTIVTELVDKSNYAIKSTGIPIAEAKWGTSKDNLTGSGTLAEAIAAAKNDSTIKYIRLNKSWTETGTSTTYYEIEGDGLTFDLKDQTVSGPLCLRVKSGNVTFTDSVGGGKWENTNDSAVIVDSGSATFIGGSYKGEDAIWTRGGATVIKGGTFESTSTDAVLVDTMAQLTIEGGSFTGGTWASVAVNGKVTIEGGSFAAGIMGHIAYYGGTLDLSGYPTTATTGTTLLTDLTISNRTDVAVAVGTTIKLPGDYSFYKSDDANKVTATELATNTKYAIKPADIISVDITWTAMEFTYTDGAWNPEKHDYDIGKWSTSGGTVTVKNTGNVTVTASFSYTATTGISGSFTKQSFDLGESASDTTKLTLSGKPSKSLNNDRIGTITVMIAQKNE